MTGTINDDPLPPDTLGAAPTLVVSISVTGLEPGTMVSLVAAATYDFSVLGCGIQPSPCTPGSDTTDPSVRLCRPAYAEQNVAGTARDTVQTVADSDGTATAVVQLIAKESKKACPADPALPWYMLSGAWTRIRVTDAAHGLRLRPEDVVTGP